VLVDLNLQLFNKTNLETVHRYVRQFYIPPVKALNK